MPYKEKYSHELSEYSPERSTGTRQERDHDYGRNVLQCSSKNANHTAEIFFMHIRTQSSQIIMFVS